MTRDGTVGRSDATERSLPLHWDIDPARVMRPRFADSIRASSPSGLHEQAGHMKRLLCGTLHFLLPGGGHPHMKRREFIKRLGRRGIVLIIGAFLVGRCILAFADLYAEGPNKSCFTAGFWHSQWPKWIGCAIAAHENLAAGLISWAVAL